MVFKSVVMFCIGWIGFAGLAAGAEIIVSNDISGSEIWTSNNTYNLADQIYVLPGASLTIQAGTVVATTPTPNGSGSLAVCKGAQIFVQGTQDNPVIMTSTADVATWTGGNPKTGTWREAANEWGNLTMMGAGYISEDATAGNVPSPNAANVAAMEGLVAEFPGDTKVLYGGGNDDDDSGSLSYLSIRYGGRVVGLANELNGLSMGGIGRETDVHHVEIMNNVDDGVETWGGTVNYKYISVWNIGDDSFDIDQGWRGKAQFIFIVQGYSLDASQGSGVGDNGFEVDGAEDSDWQPVTTTKIHNATVIGQPVAGDHGTAWRDNARVQYRNCIFMDLGEQLVKFDNVDGDGAHGYGYNGTLSWADTWTTDWNSVPAHANDPANPAAFYKTQTNGKLAEIRDSVFFRNQDAAAYTEATARGVLDAGNSNVLITSINDIDSPIQTLSRGTPVTKGGKIMVPVTYVDPRPKNQALHADNATTGDSFYKARYYRGAFAPGENWLYNWTASQAYGFTPTFGPTSLIPDRGTVDYLGETMHFDLDVNPAFANDDYLLVLGVTGDTPGTALPGSAGAVLPVNWDFVSNLVLPYNNIWTFFDFFGKIDSNGEAQARFEWPGDPNALGATLYFGFMLRDPVDKFHFASNGVQVKVADN